jgi:uncharacterized protein YaaN involved in tellurite resistance
VKDQNELQAMCKGLLKHMVQLVRLPSTTEMMDRIDVLNWDMLSTYGQDGLHQLAFVAREMLVELELENHFLH